MTPSQRFIQSEFLLYLYTIKQQKHSYKSIIVCARNSPYHEDFLKAGKDCVNFLVDYLKQRIFLSLNIWPTMIGLGRILFFCTHLWMKGVNRKPCINTFFHICLIKQTGD